jgi:hypothetical protein
MAVTVETAAIEVHGETVGIAVIVARAVIAVTAATAAHAVSAKAASVRAARPSSPPPSSRVTTTTKSGRQPNRKMRRPRSDAGPFCCAKWTG